MRSGFSIPSASGRRVDLLNEDDINPQDILRSSSVGRLSASMSPPPAHTAQDLSASPTSPSASPRAPLVKPVPEPPALGKRIYRCQDCQKVFSTSGHLTRHSKVHSGEKNHICPYPECQRRCSRRDNLLQHYTMHLTKEERDLPATYVREALSAMQARMGTYVHPYPRGVTLGSLPPPQQVDMSTMRIERSSPQHAHTSPVYSPTQRYPEHATYVRSEAAQRPVPLTSSPSPLKRPLELDMDETRRPPSMRRTSTSSSSDSLGPTTPPMPVVPPITRKEYIPQMPEERGFQVSSVRGTL